MMTVEIVRSRMTLLTVEYDIRGTDGVYIYLFFIRTYI